MSSVRSLDIVSSLRSWLIGCQTAHWSINQTILKLASLDDLLNTSGHLPLDMLPPAAQLD